MKIYTYNKKFFKESKDVQKAIISGIKKLYERIQVYEGGATPFDKIFNDDNVKYDVHGDFYTYKTQKNNLQLRILYTYLKVNEEPVILIGDYVLKKKNNKHYIERFDSANNWNPFLIYKDSHFVEVTVY